MDTVIRVVEESNQRGGRMLSLVDLIEAKSCSVGQAAWLAGRVRAGDSWLVGARPGGAGKTTVMGALLVLLREDETVQVTRPGVSWDRSGPDHCLVAYEISPGRYDGYIWGGDVRRLAECAASGTRVVSNLHADSVAEARSQIVDDCGAREEHFQSLDLFIPIVFSGGWGRVRREIKSVWRTENGSWQEVRPEEQEADAPGDLMAFLERCRRENVCTVDAVRERWLAEAGPGGTGRV